MKKCIVMTMMMLCVVLGASFAFAGNASVDGDGNAIGIDASVVGTNTNTITNNNESNSGSESAAAAASNSSLKYTEALQPYALGNAPLLQSGHPSRSSEKGFECLIVTMEDAIALSVDYEDDTSWFNKRPSKIKVALKKGSSVTSAIKIVAVAPSGSRKIGSARVFGSNGDLLDGLNNLAAKRGMEGGANLMVGTIIQKATTKTKGSSDSWGAGLAIPVDNLNLGLAKSWTNGETVVDTSKEYELEINYYFAPGVAMACEEVVSQIPASVLVVKSEPAPVAKPEPAPEVETCNPARFLEEIRRAEAKIAVCWRYSHSNMVDRLSAAKGNMDASICTGERKYLDASIEHYKMAELNFINGFDIESHSDSNAIVAEVEYGLASAIYARDGSINDFWKTPKLVKHENKKNGADKWVAPTAYEKREIMKLRNSLERYSTNLTL